MHDNYTIPVLMGSWLLHHTKWHVWLDRTQLKSLAIKALAIKAVKSIIQLMTSATFARDNHRLLSYNNNGFCNMIITLLILLHITTLWAEPW